ncbi:MAG: Acg family FMN-binding oxidoreductase [Streptosporangiaceae bacterium]|jgi:nitroreductase
MTEITQPVSNGRAATTSLPRPRVTHPPVLIPAGRVAHLIGTAARAPSIHNTQPWRFAASEYAIELHSDPSRRLRGDQGGREMLISCGAALFGLRLAIREIGYMPLVELLPDPGRPSYLARITLGDEVPPTGLELHLIAAIPHRHTHRGPFSPGPLPTGLLAGLQQDALIEGAALALVDQHHYQQLSALVVAAGRRQRLDPIARAEARRWTRSAESTARDGVPAQAFAAESTAQPGQLPQRDFDLGRGMGLLPAGGPPPPATAVLITRADTPADWLHAGQAMHRVLIRAAGCWVFASLHTQPLEVPAVRALIRSRLALPGQAQMLMQLGLSTTTQATARRPASELMLEQRRRPIRRRAAKAQGPADAGPIAPDDRGERGAALQ